MWCGPFLQDSRAWYRGFPEGHANRLTFGLHHPLSAPRGSKIHFISLDLAHVQWQAILSLLRVLRSISPFTPPGNHGQQSPTET